MTDAVDLERRAAVMRDSFIIVARGSNGVIGRGPEIPWRHSGDMRHFRNATLGCALIVGRTTFDTLPRSMPGRDVVVITSRPMPDDSDAIAVTSMEDAVEAALQTGSRAIAFAGGPRIYEAAMGLEWLGRAIITEIAAAPEGDAHMPPLGETWVSCGTTRLVSREGEPEAAVVRYERREE